MIRETEPPTPSLRLQGLGQRLEGIARCRQTLSLALARKVRGELDWIVMKALEKDRLRRYDTVSALARDLDRHLCGESASACPPKSWYRLTKLVRKHKVAFASAALSSLHRLLPDPAASHLDVFERATSQTRGGSFCVNWLIPRRKRLQSEAVEETGTGQSA